MSNTENTKKNQVENNNILPENVTEEPRNDEEMNLKPLKKSRKAVRTYLQVSDDQGELLRAKPLEKKVVAFCDKYWTMKPNEIEKPKPLLDKAEQLITEYTLQINTVESGLSGIITKYRIRQGMLFLITKKLVKASDGKWTEWFEDKFSSREFRSAQDYMRLAKIPNIIRYAVFGKERLVQILRQVDDSEKGDPVGEYLDRQGIDFNPEEEFDQKEIRAKADIAISCKRLADAGITEIPVDRVEAFVRDGNEIEAKHIRELELLKKNRGDLVQYMEDLIASDGKFEPILTPERKAEGFRKVAERFIKIAEDAVKDTDYRGLVDPALYEQLKQIVQGLEQVVTVN